MNTAEAAVLLAAISANDNREVGEAPARAWAAALPDIDLADALEWLPRYYRTATRDTRNWIYQGDVAAGVLQLHQERRARVGDDAVAQTAIGEAGEDNDPGHADLLVVRARRAALEAYDRGHLPTCQVCTEAADRAARKRASARGAS